MSSKRKTAKANPGKLLKSLGLPEDVQSATRWLRVNDKIVVHDPETEALVRLDTRTIDGKFDENIYTLPTSGFFKISLNVDRDPGNSGVFNLLSDTIIGGEVEMNFACSVRADGKVLSGQVNTFLYRAMAMDQGYFKDLLQEWAEQKPNWDVVETTAAALPSKRSKSSDASADQEPSAAQTPSKQNTDVEKSEVGATSAPKIDAATVATESSAVAEK